MQLAVIIGYLAVLVATGVWAGRRSRRSTEDYFLASRSLGPVVTVFTLAATNFSAFTVFGFSGQGWQSGYAFYPIMAFGTGFMALTFYLIGRPVHALGRAHGLLTPPDLIHHRFGSAPLRLLVLLVMTVFTLPYLAMQPMAAGYALEGLLGIPYRLGATIVMLVMLAYTFRGGLRGVALTDMIQGALMLLLMLVALFVVSGRSGGMGAAGSAVATAHPGLFTRQGVFGPGIWLGYMLLWFWADPMFPQLFQRFYSARSQRALGLSMSLYPLITGLLFLLPVALGVMSRLWIPELPEGAAVDQVLPLLLSRACPGILEALVLTVGLAALMSTLDSQLLTLSSMLVRDLWEPIAGRDAPWWAGKLVVVVLAVCGLLLSFNPPATFLDLARQAFTGLAVLFPVLIGALYWRRATWIGGVAGILAGLATTFLQHFGVISFSWTLAVVPAVLVATIVFVLVSLPTGRGKPGRAALVRWTRDTLPPGWGLLFLLLLLLANDFPLWKMPDSLFLGMPWWVWACLGLCVLTSASFAVFSRRSVSGDPQTRS